MVLLVKSCPTLLWPHWLQPIRLLRPWDFPGKNTGVGRHFLLQGIFPTHTMNPHSPALAGRFFTRVTREAHYIKKQTMFYVTVFYIKQEEQSYKVCINTDFYNYLCSYLYLFLLNMYLIFVSGLISAWRSPFGISCRVSPLVMILSISVYLGISLFHLHFWWLQNSRLTFFQYL